MKPILFSTEMVKAILEGRKTQTRRIVKVKGCKPFIPDDTWDLDTISQWNKDYHPYGKPGDVLWVRETWRIEKMDCTRDNGSYAIIDEWPVYMYAADKLPHIVKLIQKTAGWKPSIHMPKEACRLWLKITKIRVERLQSISEEDSQKEGAEKYTNMHSSVNVNSREPNYKTGFAKIWMDINGEESWNANPWVWVIEFERVKEGNHAS